MFVSFEGEHPEENIGKPSTSSAVLWKASVTIYSVSCICQCQQTLQYIQCYVLYVSVLINRHMDVGNSSMMVPNAGFCYY